VESLEARHLLSNVSVNDPSEDFVFPNGGGRFTQSETSTAVANDGTIISAFNDTEESFGNIFTRDEHVTSYAFSTDGGKTFTDAGSLPESDDGDGSDPILAVNRANGNVYFTAISAFSFNVVQFFTSTDNGHTFGPPVNVFPNVPVSDFLDKPWMTVDNGEGRGKGTIYETATDFGDTSINILVSESRDNGITWQQQQLASGFVQGSNVVVADHKAYAFWWDDNQAPTERIMMKRSDSNGVFNTTPTTVATLRTTGVDGSLGLNFRTNAFPQAAVDPNDPNTIYLVYNDVGQAAGDRGDIYFTLSKNGGRSWTTPAKINDDSTTADQFFPTITVTPDGTHLFVTWYDRRNAASPNGNMERFGVIGSIDDGTVTFGHNFDYSDAPFPESSGHDFIAAPDYMGDYDQATSDNAFFYTSFVDTRRGNQDVFFEKIPLTGPSVASRMPWLVVQGSPDAAAKATSTTPSVRRSSFPSSMAGDGSSFVILGPAPASLAADAHSPENVAGARRESASLAAPVLSSLQPLVRIRSRLVGATATVGSESQSSASAARSNES
jgi:hypothetical protein